MPLTDPGYLLGDGVFATMRGYDGVCFRAERHLAILVRGADLFGLTLPVGVDRLIAIADEAASRTRVRDAYVRVTLTRSIDEARAVLSVISRPLDVPAKEAYAEGVMRRSSARAGFPRRASTRRSRARATRRSFSRVAKRAPETSEPVRASCSRSTDRLPAGRWRTSSS